MISAVIKMLTSVFIKHKRITLNQHARRLRASLVGVN
jgi:hypothetical protein